MTPTLYDLLAVYRAARTWFYAERDRFYIAQESGDHDHIRIMQDALTHATVKRIEAETAVAVAWLAGRDPDTVQLPSATGDTRDLRVCVIAHLARVDAIREITTIPEPPHYHKLTPDPPHWTAEQFVAMYRAAVLKV